MFTKLYHSGARLVVPIALAAAAANAASAYFALDSTATNLFSTGSVLTLGTLAFTGTAMMGTNQRLLALNEQLGAAAHASEAVEKETTVLLQRWTNMNYVRGAMGLIGGLAAVLGLAIVAREIMDSRHAMIR